MIKLKFYFLEKEFIMKYLLELRKFFVHQAGIFIVNPIDGCYVCFMALKAYLVLAVKYLTAVTHYWNIPQLTGANNRIALQTIKVGMLHWMFGLNIFMIITPKTVQWI